MAHLLNLKTFADERGKLTVLEKLLPFEVKRIFYIYDVNSSLKRGWHRHIKNIQAAICIQWSCSLYVNNAKEEKTFLLETPDVCLILEPQDWHTMDFSSDAILLVLASENFDSDDYISEPYQ